MSFYLFFLCGFFGGVFGGMGMGGGTVLIPLLTLAGGVEQLTAQLCNLLAFLPMAAISLSLHAKNGLVDLKNVLPLCASATLFSLAGSFLARALPSAILGRGFGFFLIFLALWGMVGKKGEKK